MSYQELTEIFNRNLKHINFEISLTKYIELKNEYGAEDRGHLAKILSLRSIKLYSQGDSVMRYETNKKEDKKMKAIEKFLMSDGFELNVHGDAWDKKNTRVYFDDIDIIVVRFNNCKAQLIEWKNRIDGNMPLDAKISVIFTMARV